MKIHGIIPALLACYDDEGAVSTDRQAALVEHVLAIGAHGVFVGGSTGEAFLQSAEERKDITTAAVQQVAGRATVIAHTGCLDTRSTLELTEHATEAGADAVSVITPVYYQYDAQSYARYFREVAAATNLPLLAYHIPSRTHADLSPDFFLRLADEGVIQGLKYTATDLYPLAEVVRQAAPNFIVLNGSDEVLAGGLTLGAVGGIGSTYNVLARTYNAVLTATRDGRPEEALAQQHIANRFIHAMNRHDFLVFLREALRLQEVDTGNSRGPLPVADAQERDEIRRAIDGDLVLSAAVRGTTQ